jgi:purine-cytosine permease-like protein
MERWTFALALGLPLALLQTCIFGSGDIAEMAGGLVGGIVVYGLVAYGGLVVVDAVSGAIRGTPEGERKEEE